MFKIERVLPAEKLETIAARLATASWVDGRATAGNRSAEVKRNRQLAEDDPVAREIGGEIIAALATNALFAAAALTAKISPPLFNRYEGGEAYGDHIDGSVRPLGKLRMRTDLSATLFLSDPESYDGGELVIRDLQQEHRIKLQAGDLFLYAATSIHRVEPVRRGARFASVFWIQSLVRDAEHRAYLYALDQTIQAMTKEGAKPEHGLALTALYHNLVRLWADV